MIKVLLIGLGGGLGSILRYLTQELSVRILPVTFPFGTFFVNVIGCFVIGLLFALTEKFAGFSAEWRLFLITGVCGGYTTFSTFSLESFSLVKEGNYAYFLVYVLASVVVGILATVAGYFLFR